MGPSPKHRRHVPGLWPRAWDVGRSDRGYSATAPRRTPISTCAATTYAGPGGVHSTRHRAVTEGKRNTAAPCARSPGVTPRGRGRGRTVDTGRHHRLRVL